MKFYSPNSDIYIPDGVASAKALQRTTHLCIAAHQDDIEILAYHGIAECYHQTDRWFTGVTVTDGAGSSRIGPYAAYSNEQMKAIRREEQRQAAQIGRYAAQIQLGYSSANVKDVQNEAVTSDLHTILKQTKPETVYLHNPADKHDTHIAVFGHSLQALRRLPQADRPKKVYGCEAWRNLDWMNDADKQALDASAYPNIAAALINIFDSQISGGKRYDLATIGRRLANATFFQSHHSDQSDAITWAMDLTPLIDNDSLSVRDYVSGYIKCFEQDVLKRLERFSP